MLLQGCDTQKYDMDAIISLGKVAPVSISIDNHIYTDPSENPFLKGLDDLSRPFQDKKVMSNEEMGFYDSFVIDFLSTYRSNAWPDILDLSEIRPNTLYRQWKSTRGTDNYIPLNLNFIRLNKENSVLLCAGLNVDAVASFDFVYQYSNKTDSSNSYPYQLLCNVILLNTEGDEIVNYIFESDPASFYTEDYTEGPVFGPLSMAFYEEITTSFLMNFETQLNAFQE